jgi:hypothetical protein
LKYLDKKPLVLIQVCAYLNNIWTQSLNFSPTLNLSLCLWITAFDYPFGILVIVLSVLWFTLLITPLVFWSLHCLSVIYSLWLSLWYFSHCIVCPLIYGLSLPLWYVGHCIVCLWFTACDYPFGILVIVLSVCDLQLLITPLVFWWLYCLSFDLRLVIIPLVF